MNEKAVCKSVFKQKKADKEHFTEMMAKMINSVERAKVIPVETI